VTPAETSFDSPFRNARQVLLSCGYGEIAVDVVVTPAEFKPGIWTLSDRLGRAVGEIYQASNGQVLVHPDLKSALLGIQAIPYATLDDAMSAIASHMKGECQLSSGDK
jgi:hypothetical protein